MTTRFYPFDPEADWSERYRDRSRFYSAGHDLRHAYIGQPQPDGSIKITDVDWPTSNRPEPVWRPGRYGWLPVQLPPTTIKINLS